MTSAAPILGNRRNAQESARARRPKSEAGAGPKAGRYGLPAEEVVIQGEDPQEFDSFRDEMWAELAPVGAVETLLARRAVGLSWRLRRVERLQRTVFEAIYREDVDDLVLWPKAGLPVKPGPGDDDLVLGAVVLADLARAKVFDKLLVYERRIENSLYRTMAELQKQRRLREAATPMPAPAAHRGKSLKCKVSSVKQEGPGEESGATSPRTADSELQTSHFILQTPEIASDDATTNGAAESSCGTQPSWEGVSSLKCQALSEESPVAGLLTSNLPLETSHSAAGRSCETKPICGAGGPTVPRPPSLGPPLISRDVGRGRPT